MSGMKKRVVPAAVMLLVTGLLIGCSQTPHSEVDQHACQQGTPVCRYFVDVQQRIRDNFADFHHYQGQRCRVTAERRADGGYNVIRTEGDEAICLKAWQSISSVRGLPLPPRGAAKTMVVEFIPLPTASSAAADAG